jgi:hypothetical protein
VSLPVGDEMQTVVDHSVLSLPREQWLEHPHYPQQALLLGSHRHFRRLSRILAQRAENGGDTTAIRRLFVQWKHMMTHGHERYEEHKLYPYLEARWEISCGALREEHADLHACDAAVREALDSSDSEASPALAEALWAHDAVLNEHLDREEEIVVPALLALSPGEFETYSHSDIRTLLRTLR